MEHLHLAIFTGRLLLKPLSLQYKEYISQGFTVQITTY
jgi:hypothetical protein